MSREQTATLNAKKGEQTATLNAEKKGNLFLLLDVSRLHERGEHLRDLHSVRMVSKWY
jgi:hypothetical protein